MMIPLLASVLLLVAPSRAQAPESPLLVTVNGEAVRRADVEQRVWLQHADAALNEIVDEILLRQEAGRLKLKPDAKEVDARLKRIRDQLGDDETFRKRLAASGSSEEALRASIEQQVLREALVTKAADLRATDAEAKAAFEANKEKLGTPDGVRLRHLLVAGEKEAGDFLVALRAGADFAKLAGQVSLDAGTKERGGDMGVIARGVLKPEIEKLFAGTKPGEIVGPLKTAGGWSLFQIVELRPARPATFKDVAPALKQALLADKIAKAWPGYLSGLRGKAKIEPAAAPAR